MCFSVKKSKRGISLVVVIVTVLALIIFSSIIFTASARSLSMTGISTDSRQTYLKAKSAIQYAHMLVCEKAKKNGSLTEFSVGPDGDSFQELPTSCSPDGTKCYAQCKNVSGSQWKISALVKGKNSGKMQKLNYTFTLTFNVAISPNTFLLAGARYDGRAQVIDAGKTPNSFNVSTDAQSPYPMVFSASDVECTSTVRTRVPEAYFINDGGLQFGADAGGAQWTLSSNFVYFKTKITADASKTQHLFLENKLWARTRIDPDNTDYQILHPDAYDSSYAGIVCFGTANQVQIGGTTPNIAAGYYYFKNGTDLLNSDTYINGNLKRITNMAEIEDGTPDITVQMGSSQNNVGKFPTKTYVTNVNYLNSSTLSKGYPLVSSEHDGGIGWTYGGTLQWDPDHITHNGQVGKDVYLNLCPNGLNELSNLKIPLTFTAHSITFEIENLSSGVFTAPLQHLTFQVDPLDTSNTTSVPGRIWLNVQNYNGSPWLNPSEETVLKPTSSTSALYAGYPADSSKSVILVLPHGLKVVENGKLPFELSRQFTDPSKTNYVDPHDPSTYTYTVPCGTNLLDVDAMRAGIKKYVSTGAPVPGGASYTITDGKYTFS